MGQLGPLVGTPSKLTLTDAEGNIIVKEGEIITSGVIDAARLAGRLPDLMLTANAAFMGETIEPAGKYIEIGEEDPTGVHPE